MEQIASFTIDHNRLQPGMYLARRDGDIVTLDLRFKKPNTGDLLTNSEMHSVEHLIATLLRNSAQKDAVIYFGPMGCQTGFYFLFDSRLLDLEGAVALMKQVVSRPPCLRAKCRARAPWSAATTAIWTWTPARPSAAFMPGSSGTGQWKSWHIEPRKYPLRDSRTRFAVD